MIKKPLSKEILFGKLTNGGVVELGIEDDKIVIKIADILPISKIKNNEQSTVQTED